MSILIGIILIIVGMLIMTWTYKTSHKWDHFYFRDIQGYGTGLLFILAGILNFIYKLLPPK